MGESFGLLPKDYNSIDPTNKHQNSREKWLTDNVIECCLAHYMKRTLNIKGLMIQSRDLDKIFDRHDPAFPKRLNQQLPFLKVIKKFNKLF